MKILTCIGHSGLQALMLLAVVAVTGCSGSKTPTIVSNPSTPVGLPTPAAPGQVNTYWGAQNPGAWSLTLNHTNRIFSYHSVSSAASTTTGSIETVNGFTRLGATGGYALEVQGRAAVLRPGDVTAPLVFAVPQTSCYSISGRLLFQYIGMQAGKGNNGFGGAGPTVGYGSIAASTDSVGKSWQFGDMQGNIVAGPASFAGECGAANGQDVVGFTGQQSVLNDIWYGELTTASAPSSGMQSNIWIGPSGFMVADQSDPRNAPLLGSSVAGIAEPASVLNTDDMTSMSYKGFLYESATTGSGGYGAVAASANTLPVAFGLAVSSGSVITGGAYPNDDVSQTPDADILVDLGKQSATYNGLYLTASITVLDPAQNCANYTGNGESATSGIGANGYITCTFPGVAVAGNPEGKYALFISSYNWAARLGGAPMQIYLFQQ
jgi:hypothetical protein